MEGVKLSDNQQTWRTEEKKYKKSSDIEQENFKVNQRMLASAAPLENKKDMSRFQQEY